MASTPTRTPPWILAPDLRHDIGSLLQSIGEDAGALRRLLEEGGESADEVRAIASRIEHASWLARATIRQADPAAPSAPTCDDLGALLRRVAGSVASTMATRGRVVVQVEDVPPVIGSDSDLGRVFLNVVLSAVEALPEGSPELHEVRIRASCTTGRFVRVEVRDTGRGVDRVHRWASEPCTDAAALSPGRRNGLSLASGIVEKLGGRLLVLPAPNVGTVAIVTLPVAAA